MPPKLILLLKKNKNKNHIFQSKVDTLYFVSFAASRLFRGYFERKSQCLHSVINIYVILLTDVESEISTIIRILDKQKKNNPTLSVSGLLKAMRSSVYFA